MNRYGAALLAGLFLLTAPISVVAADEPAGAAEAEAKAPRTIEIFKSLKMTIPADWKPQQVRSRIIEHEFAAPVEGDDQGTARVTMMAAGGDIDANINRWKGQFQGDSEAKIEKLDVAGSTIHLVELEGSFKETMGGGPFSGGKTVTRENYGMLGAIIVHPSGRQYFIKLTGPKKTVEAHREAFKAMLKGLQA